MRISWVDGYRIKVDIHDKEVLISANREGLLSLACQMKALAEGMPGDHIHYGADNSLEEGSPDMIIERTE